MEHRSVITIGSFDGVHRGHAALIARALEIARPRNLAVTALVFDPHPLTLLRPDSAPARLSTLAQRKSWLKELGVERVVPIEPTPTVLSQSAELFIDHAVYQHAPAAIVEGPDFRFGRGRAGTVQTLAELGDKKGFTAEIVDTVDVVLNDHQLAPARSSVARHLVALGRVRDAQHVLGRAYELDGVVTRGDRRGRTIGFPTANLDTECLLPADGVYAGLGVLPDGRTFPAAINVGERPTFVGAGRSVEAHLLGVTHNGSCISDLDEYGWRLRLRFFAHLRDACRFESVDALRGQLALDIERAGFIAAHARASWDAPRTIPQGELDAAQPM